MSHGLLGSDVVVLLLAVALRDYGVHAVYLRLSRVVRVSWKPQKSNPLTCPSVDLHMAFSMSAKSSCSA